MNKSTSAQKGCLALIIILMVMFLFNVYWTTNWKRIRYNSAFDWEVPLGIQGKIEDAHPKLEKMLGQVLKNQQMIINRLGNPSPNSN